jgi:hypothetical protein
MAQNPHQFNYDHEKLKRWIEDERTRLKEEKGWYVQDFADELSSYVGEDFTKNHLNKFMSASIATRPKTLRLKVLKAFAGYRKESVEATKKWLNWKNLDEMNLAKQANSGSLGDRLAEVERKLSALTVEMSKIRTQMNAIQKTESPEVIYPPFTKEVRRVLKNADIDPDTEEGRSRITAAVSESDLQPILDILSGESYPHLAKAGSILVMLAGLVGEDAFNADLMREHTALSFVDKKLEPTLG